jgi:para-nitrobenzyl esterase
LEQECVRREAQWGATTLAELRALPAETIQAAPRPMSLGAAGPVVDGKYVPEDVPAAFAAGKQAPVPFLLGANSNEASLMTAFGVTPGEMLATVVAAGDKLRQFYGDDQQKAAQGLFTDAIFLAPARYLAAQMEKVKQPAYLYFFSYLVEHHRPQTTGVPHGGEIPFVFGNFPAPVSFILTPSDRHFADTVSYAWVQFAQTGNPNRDGLPEWPAYTPATDRLLEWGTPIAVRQRFRAEQLDLLTAATLARPK